MKPRTTFVMALAFLLAACGLFSSPTSTVKKFMAAAQKCDAEAMTQLFSKKAVQRIGLDTIRSNNQLFCDTLKRASAAGGEYRIENMQETPTPEGRKVSLIFKAAKGNDSLKIAFALSKESGVWKIDDIGGGDDGDLGASSPSPEPSTAFVAPIPPPKAPANENTKSATTDSKRPPIAGGVLNSKAISLPTPVYPPAARVVKAAGVVIVQVTVDERGEVILARAVSGHPLLEAAAIAAARGAKFPPVKLSGEPVKVNGVITYKFAPQ